MSTVTGRNMLFLRAQKSGLFCAFFIVAAFLTACTSAPEAPRPPALAQPTPTAPQQPLVEKFQLALAEGITLDYQVEKKLSKVNGKSCFAFITGKLNNQSDKTLSKKTVLDVSVVAQGKQLYRDNTSPLADIPTGFNAPFEMVVSPVFSEGCPTFDKINVALRKVVL